MSYTLLEEIRIRLDKYSVQTDESGNVVVFDTDAKLDVKLEQLIAKAKQDIIAYRHYPSNYSNEKINADIEKHYHNTIIDLVLYDYSIEGADFEVAHSENGVNRTFIKRESILGKVLPFVDILF